MEDKCQWGENHCSILQQKDKPECEMTQSKSSIYSMKIPDKISRSNSRWAQHISTTKNKENGLVKILHSLLRSSTRNLLTKRLICTTIIKRTVTCGIHIWTDNSGDDKKILRIMVVAPRYMRNRKLHEGLEFSSCSPVDKKQKSKIQ